MIYIILQLIFLYFIIIFVKNIIDMKKYNEESQLVELKNLNIDNDKKIMDPLLINYKFDKDINIDKFIDENPLYSYCNNDLCIRLSDFYLLDNINIYDNQKLIHDLNLNITCKTIFDKFQNIYSFNTKYTCSLFKGSNNTMLEKNKNNINILGCINGKCNIYLYNPKHKDNLNEKNIKKYAIKVDIEKGKLLYIPSEWYYNITTIEDCCLIHIKSDTYFTSLYNEYRN